MSVVPLEPHGQGSRESLRPSSNISFTEERESLGRGGACLGSQADYSEAGPPVSH